jgi:hypothetical protein
MNTGIQDAHNLAFKLADALDGTDHLSIYERERRPVAVNNTILSLANYRRVLDISSMLGVNGDDLFRVGAILKNSSLVASVHASAGSAAFAKASALALSVGRAPLACLKEKGHVVGESKRARLQQHLKAGNGLPLFFPRHELAFSYGPPDLNDNDGERLRPLDIRVGMRAPHCRLLLRHSRSAASALFTLTDLPAQLHRHSILTQRIGTRRPHVLVTGLPFSDG